MGVNAAKIPKLPQDLTCESAQVKARDRINTGACIIEKDRRGRGRRILETRASWRAGGNWRADMTPYLQGWIGGAAGKCPPISLGLKRFGENGACSQAAMAQWI